MIALAVLAGAATLSVARLPSETSWRSLGAWLLTGLVCWLFIGPQAIWRLSHGLAWAPVWPRRIVLGTAVIVLAGAFGVAEGFVAALVGLRPMVQWLANVFYYLDVNLAALVLAIAVERLVRSQRELLAREEVVAALSGELSQVRQLFLARQVRPHFLFNALNAAAADARNRPRVAAETLRSLRTLLESAASAEGAPTQPIRDELRILQAFVTIAKARYDAALDIELTAEPASLDALVPPLALQPILENAIQFAMAAAHDVGVVRMRIAARAGRLAVTVRNSCAASPGATGLGIGLQNTRRRLELLFGSDFTLEHRRERGEFVVALNLPLTLADAAVAGPPARDEALEAPKPELLSGALRLAAFAALCWVGIGFFWAYQMHFYREVRGIPRMPVIPSGVVDFMVAAVWAVLTPLILLLVRRFPLTAATWKRHVPLHLAAAIGAGLVERTVLSLSGVMSTVPAAKAVNQLALDCFLYGLILAWGQLRAFTRWMQSRGSQADRLRGAIDETRSRSRTLGPDATLTAEALGRITDLLEASPAEGEDGIVRTAEALRALLAISERNEVTLLEAVQAASAAAELRAVASGVRLRVTLAVPRELRQTLVQPAPIVELAQRLPLGDGGTSGGTVVALSASRDTAGDGLSVRVTSSATRATYEAGVAMLVNATVSDARR